MCMSNVFKFTLFTQGIWWYISNHRRNLIPSWTWAQCLLHRSSLLTCTETISGSIPLIFQRSFISSWSWHCKCFLSLISTFHGKFWHFLLSFMEIWIITSRSWDKLGFYTSNWTSIFKFQSHTPWTILYCFRRKIISLHSWGFWFSNSKPTSFTRSESPLWSSIFHMFKIWIIRIGWWPIASPSHCFFLVISGRRTNHPWWIFINCWPIEITVCTWTWNITCSWFFKPWA